MFETNLKVKVFQSFKSLVKQNTNKKNTLHDKFYLIHKGKYHVCFLWFWVNSQKQLFLWNYMQCSLFEFPFVFVLTNSFKWHYYNSLSVYEDGQISGAEGK